MKNEIKLSQEPLLFRKAKPFFITRRFIVFRLGLENIFKYEVKFVLTKNINNHKKKKENNIMFIIGYDFRLKTL